MKNTIVRGKLSSSKIVENGQCSRPAVQVIHSHSSNRTTVPLCYGFVAALGKILTTHLGLKMVFACGGDFRMAMKRWICLRQQLRIIS